MSAGLALPSSGALVVVDLEYTSWEGALARGWSGPGEHREVVQIGAVRLDAANGFAETAAFSRFAFPRANPALSAYFTALTGIDDARLAAEAVASDAAVGAFARFAEGAVIASHGGDDAVIAETAALHGFGNPLEGRPWVDIAPPIRALTGRKAMSAELPALLGLAAPETAHDALADARALARVLRHFRERGLA